MLILLSLFVTQTANAQSIVADPSLPSNSVIDSQDGLHTISGGTQAGSNLFHSFSEFNVPSGNEAFFDNASDISNILGRVTGNNSSVIDGFLSNNGDANLFLVNPNGIVFGPDAALDIGGTFTATTADSITFEDGSSFSAINQSNPILSVSLPTGVQLGEQVSIIEINGNGSGLFTNDFFEPDRSNKAFGLDSFGQINLIAGEIVLDGGNTSSPNLNLVAGSNGEVGFTESGLDPSGVENLGDIFLDNDASIDASGDGGQIEITARNLSLNNGAAIIALNELDGEQGGTINLNIAENLDLSGESAFELFPSFISVDNPFFATEPGGTINITTGNLNIDAGAVISASTQGAADGGVVNVEATGDINLNSGGSFFSSIIAETGDIGTGGEINLNANAVNVTNGAAIGLTSYGDGDGGTLNINASTVDFSQVEFDEEGNVFSVLIAADTNGAGVGGTINIKSQDLNIADFAQVTTSATGTGNAGEINIESDDITLTNTNIEDGYVTGIFNASGIEDTPEVLGNGGDINLKGNNLSISNDAFISARTLSGGDSGNINLEVNNIEIDRGGINTAVLGEGNGGNLTVTTDNLSLLNGGQINTSTDTSGDAGSVDINAQNITVTGKSELGNSAILSLGIIGSGKGGDIAIKSDDLEVNDGGTISVSNFSTVNADLLPGTGTPGTIDIETNTLNINGTEVDNPSTINASVNATTGGDITINSNDLSLNGAGANINAESKGAGAGGSIALTSDRLSLNNGAITVNADSSGNAGDITINTPQIQSDGGSIVAESQVSGGGDIAITSNNINLDNQSLISTSVQESDGGGGNITINNSELILNQNNSDIRANAEFGPGGNIDIVSKLFFTSFDSDISASSTFGLDGNVTIESPDSEKQLTPEILPNQVIDPTGLITALCPISDDNSFAYTGNGGIPQDYSNAQSAQRSWDDTRFSANQVSTVKPKAHGLVEAKRILPTGNNEFVLVGNIPVESPIKSGCNS